MRNKIFMLLLVILIIPSNSLAIGGLQERNGYLYYISVPSSSVVMNLYAEMYGRAKSRNTENVWYCTDNYWMDNGMQVVLKELDVSYDLIYGPAQILYATGQSLSTISKFQVSGLRKVVLGSDNAGVNGGVDCRILANAFAGYSGNLETIILNKPIVSIGDNAFDGLKSGAIICNRETPPELSQNAFNEMAFNNVILVVPANSLDKYRNSTWGLFKTILTDSEVNIPFSVKRITMFTNESSKITFEKEVNYDEWEWRSSDSNIVEVSNGLIKAKKAGKATITATNKYDYTTSCSVEVLQGVTSININDTQDIKNGNLTLYTGTPYNLDDIDITIEPEDAVNKNLIWEIMDEDIATIHDGFIYPNFAGETQILIKAISGCSATINLKVQVDKFTYNGLNYQVDKDGQTCKVIASSVEGDVVIPETAYFGLNSYEVTGIGNSAFWCCSKMTSVHIPNTIKTIGNSAFQYCTSLTEITIPNGVNILNDRIFQYCSSLSVVSIPNSITTIGSFAFAETSIVNIKIPDSVTEIYNYAFYGCQCLDAIEFGNSVRVIDDSAFQDCSKLKSINIPNSVAYIGDGAFSRCYSLDSLTIPSSVTRVGAGAFSNCKSLKELTIEDGNKPLEFAKQYPVLPTPFENSPLEKIYIGRDFYGDNSNAFIRKTDLRQLIIGDVVTYLPTGAFRYCSSLESVTLGQSLEVIDKWMFEECTEIMNISIKAISPPFLYGGCFNESIYNRTKLYVPRESIADYKNDNGWKNFFYINALGDILAESIELNMSSLTLNVDEGYTLIATILPENATDNVVIWESSDESIAAVDANGQVTGIAVGNAIIKATAASGVYVTCDVNVVETPATGIIIDKDALGIMDDNLEMRVGDIKAVKATVTPETTTDKSVAYESSDPTVAGVDANGNITALQPGIATITITAKSGVSVSFNVIVIAPMALSIELEPTTINAVIGTEIQLIAKILPELASEQPLSWSSSNSEVASVSTTGLVEILKEGAAVIEVRTTDGSDLIATCNVLGVSSIESILADMDSCKVDIYTPQGVCVKRNASLSDVKSLLPGLYIIAGKKMLIK